jgi:hypothetical protein
MGLVHPRQILERFLKAFDIQEKDIAQPGGLKKSPDVVFDFRTAAVHLNPFDVQIFPGYEEKIGLLKEKKEAEQEEKGKDDVPDVHPELAPDFYVSGPGVSPSVLDRRRKGATAPVIVG